MRTPVGSLSGDAGVDAAADVGVEELSPLMELRQGMLGRFCGTATGSGLMENIEIEFDEEEYLIDCGCLPVPGQSLQDVKGIYFVGQLDVDGKGWGRAMESLGGNSYKIELRRIGLKGDKLTLTRRYDLAGAGSLPSTSFDLRRCPDGVCDGVAGCEPLEANGD